VLAAVPGNEMEIDAPAVANVSFPGFRELIHGLASGSARS
jgi:5-enolpyruvylshikimate-3-phosphate synthase